MKIDKNQQMIWSKHNPKDEEVLIFDDYNEEPNKFIKIYNLFHHYDLDLSEHARYNVRDRDLWFINHNLYKLILFTELTFNTNDIPTVLFCQELINSWDLGNIYMAACILENLKPII